MKVDVIIPVYNQKNSLSLTLDGMRNQQDNNQVHIIVVDDGSDEKIYDLLDDFKDLDITYIYQKNKGRALARNIGIQNAENEIIIFCDADRIPGPGFIDKHVNRLKTRENIICIGALKEVYFSNPEENKTKIKEIVKYNGRMAREPLHYKNSEYLFDEQGNSISSIPWISTYSGNMSMWKYTLDREGGFDPNFYGWGFEHFELGYRMYKMGVGFVRERGAINYHIAHRRSEHFYLNSIINSHQYFYQKYPEKEIYLLKKYMVGELSLQEYEREVAGQVKWAQLVNRELYIKVGGV